LDEHEWAVGGPEAMDHLEGRLRGLY
jgi:hypothetical protein